jgi:hypothetical protein
MINYKLLGLSSEYYENNGFARVEIPWAVSEYTDKITKPKDVISFQLKHNNKCLVASGEQSFIYQYLKGFLPLGQFQGITPCFRFESFDFEHSKYFMKNELIKTDVVNDYELRKIVDLCLDFYKQFIPATYIKNTEKGYDIEYNGHELGSYGIRNHYSLDWIYGTGCAEPRLSSLIKLYKIENGLPQ